MNIFAHATTAIHEENNSAMHWIQTDGIKFLLVALVIVALYFGIKQYLGSKDNR